MLSKLNNNKKNNIIRKNIQIINNLCEIKIFETLNKNIIIGLYSYLLKQYYINRPS